MTKRQKTAFGQYLVDQIKVAGMSQEVFYTKVGITKPYFYDLLHSDPPPAALQRRIAAVLDEQTGIDLCRQRMLFDLAAQEREEIPADIDELIKTDKANWDKIREKLNLLLD